MQQDLSLKCVICNACTFKRCSVCLSVTYCDKKCQKEHWSIHKNECKEILRTGRDLHTLISDIQFEKPFVKYIDGNSSNFTAKNMKWTRFEEWLDNQSLVMNWSDGISSYDVEFIKTHIKLMKHLFRDTMYKHRMTEEQQIKKKFDDLHGHNWFGDHTTSAMALPLFGLHCSLLNIPQF